MPDTRTLRLHLVTLALACVTLACGSEPAGRSAPTAFVAVPITRTREPDRPRPRAAVAEHGWQPARAARYLDEHADRWLETRFGVGNVRCALSCHTTFTFAFARPRLPAVSAVLPRLRTRVESRVTAPAAWDGHVAYYGKPGSVSWRASLATEAVLSAAALALSGGGQSARVAVDGMWRMQQADGAWPWIDFGLEPWEAGNRSWGASMAAIAAGIVEGEQTPRASSLRRWLRARYAEGDMRLFDQLALVWASTHLSGLLDERETARVVEALVARQREGAWSTAELIGADGAGEVDGIATGLGAYVLCRTGLERSRALEAVRWLRRRQAADGSWPARSISTGRSRSNRFMKNAATAFAVLALTECDGAAIPGG